MPAFKLRPWRHDDLPSLVKYANDEGISQWMTDSFQYPYTVSSGEAFLNRVIPTDGTEPNVMAIEVDEEAAGSIGIFPQQDIFHRNAELGYWLARKHWGRGIMTEVLVQMVDRVFDRYEYLERLFARPFGNNFSSQRVLEKAGFLLEAKFHGTIIKNGKVQDELVYAIRR
jgi:RimJ/RimL family protein N-acetyltransferase